MIRDTFFVVYLLAGPAQPYPEIAHYGPMTAADCAEAVELTVMLRGPDVRFGHALCVGPPE